MPQGLVIPYRFTPELEADANEVNACFDAVAAKFNGGVVDGDCSAQMDLDGNKLSQTSGKQIPNLALATNSVDNRVLASSTTSDTGRAVTGDHVRALIAADIARILPAGAIGGGGINSDKVNIEYMSCPFNIAAGALIVAGMGMAQGAVPPTTARASATYKLVGLYLTDVAISGAGNAVWSASAVATTGANWTATVSILVRLAVAGNATGNLVYVFLRAAP